MIKTSPRTSVIMPTYNGAAFIAGSIRSVLSQTDRDFELIIVNDGSTDDTQAVVNRFTDKRIVSLEQTNQGTSRARNNGLRHARGRYIAYCDHDDLFDRQHIQKLATYLDRQPAVGLVYGDYRYRFATYPGPVHYPIRSFDRYLLTVKNIVGPPLNVMHRAVCLTQSGAFDESPTISSCSCEDWDLWLRIAEHYPCRHLPGTIGTFVYHRTNRSHTVLFEKAHAYLVTKYWHTRRSDSSRHAFIEQAPDKIVEALLCMPGSFVGVSRLAGEFFRFKKTARTYCARGLCAYREGRFPAAITLLRSGVALTRRGAETAATREIRGRLYTYLARSCLQRGQRAAAARYARRLSVLPGRRAEAQRIAARCAYYQKDYRRALWLLRGCRIVDETAQIRAASYTALKQYRKAAATLVNALRRFPQDTALRYNLALIYLHAGQHKKARTALKELLSRKPRHTAARRLFRRHCRMTHPGGEKKCA